MMGGEIRNRTVKRMLRVLLIALAGLCLFWIYYFQKHNMGVVDSFDINDISKKHKFLIASQQSIYKDSLLGYVLKDYYKQDSIVIHVTDVTMLEDEDQAKYDGIILIHTWEIWKAPVEVNDFLIPITDLDDSKDFEVIRT